MVLTRNMDSEARWRSPSRFKKLSTTASLEFLRLLRGGELALLHLPSQHGASVKEVLASHGLTPSDASHVCADVSYTEEFGLWSPKAEWRCSELAAKLPQQAITALCLQALLSAIESGWYRKQEMLGRLVLRNELLALWWDLFVIPELESRGRSRTRSKQAGGSGLFVKQQKAKGVPRDVAKLALIEKYAIGEQRANKLLAQAGYTGTRGPRKKIK